MCVFVCLFVKIFLRLVVVFYVLFHTSKRPLTFNVQLFTTVRSPNPRAASALPQTPRTTTPRDAGSLLFPESLNPQHDHVSLTCLGLLCSPVIIESSEGSACPDATHFLLAGTEVCNIHLLQILLSHTNLQSTL